MSIEVYTQAGCILPGCCRRVRNSLHNFDYNFTVMQVLVINSEFGQVTVYGFPAFRFLLELNLFF